MINIKVNGNPVVLPAPVSVAELLDQLGYQNDFVAVALNHVHIRRGDFATACIDGQTDVEILAPMAGG